MAQNFRSAAVPASEHPGVVAVHCSDPRYQPHFQDFLRNGLGLTSYGLIAVPGGPQFLTRLDFLPKFPWVGWRWTKFLVDVVQPERLILIAHDDCRWYFSLPFFHDRARIPERQKEDLRSVRAELTERFNIPRIELYYARLADSSATFEAL